MSIRDMLESEETSNILTEHGFTFERSSITGKLDNCYEKRIIDDIDSYWIAVKITTGEVVIYHEYECGGEIDTRMEQINTKWSDSQSEFYEELLNLF